MVTADTGSISLIPGTPTPPQFPLARYRPTQLSGVVREFAESATDPNGPILVVGASCGATVREVVEAGRRVVAMYRSPVDQLCASVHVTDCPPDSVQAALTQLADQRKGERPLLLHIRDLYRTNCPRCLRPGTAEWFAWDRDAGRPFSKAVRCAHCGGTVEGPVTDQDIVTAGRYPTTGGPAYHLALSRAREHRAVNGRDESHRITQLIQLYTSRNLGILMDIVNRLPRLRLPDDVSGPFISLLLEAFDQASVLTAYDAPEERPRSLRPPQRFLERNVWLILEDAMRALRETVPASQLRALRHDSLDSLLAHREPGYLLLNRSVQDLDPRKLGTTFQGMVLAMAPPDAATWALSTLWAIWLWGDEIPAGLARFLRRRRLDWDWYRRSLAFALGRVRPLLVADAPVLAMSARTDPAAARAIIHAANATGLEPVRWLVCPPHGFRLVGRLAASEPLAGAARETLQSARDHGVIERLIEARGEPADGSEVITAAVIDARDPDVARFDQLIDLVDNVEPISDNLLWLRTTDRAAVPLADRAEEAIRRCLTGSAAQRRRDLERVLYATFNGICTPAPELVDGIVDAYTVEDDEGRLWLRPEDDAQRRRDEIRELRQALQDLGERLGYRVVRRLGRDLIWRDGSQVNYLFRFSATANLATHLLREQPSCDGRRCLIVPGGRAALIALKLRRDPRLADLAASHRWTFIKFRHLRRMMREITQRAETEVYLGLDPIVERASAQIPMPLDIDS